MSEFKFEHELNPSSRAAAALDNEGQRILDEIEQARHSFRAELQRVSAGSVIMLATLIGGALYGFQHIQVTWLLAYALAVVGLVAVLGSGDVARLLASGSTVRRGKRELAEWNAIRHELRSSHNPNLDETTRSHAELEADS